MFVCAVGRPRRRPCGRCLRLRCRLGEEHVCLAIDGLEARRLALAGCRHLFGQIENVIRVRRSLVRRRVVPREHRIDVMLLHG